MGFIVMEKGVWFREFELVIPLRDTDSGGGVGYNLLSFPVGSQFDFCCHCEECPTNSWAVMTKQTQFK
jgi:hypothetical protein